MTDLAHLQDPVVRAGWLQGHLARARRVVRRAQAALNASDLGSARALLTDELSTLDEAMRLLARREEGRG